MVVEFRPKEHSKTYGAMNSYELLVAWIFSVAQVAVGQNLRYLFSRDYHLFKRLFKGHRGYRDFDPVPGVCLDVWMPRRVE